jgi:succinyl-CoA synthetase beta subunit
VSLAEKILGMQLITKQTGPNGQKVRRLYIEQGVAIEREIYLAMLTDRDRRRVAVLASAEGGMDIEEVAEKSPEKLLTLHVDPLLGLAPYQARAIAFFLGVREKGTQRQLLKLLEAMYRAYIAEDCSMLEINPLIVTKSGDVMALDAKVTFDDNADFRHPEWEELRDIDEEDPIEAQAKKAGFSYVSLDGDIGCLVNGAGLAMGTMDIILHYGGEPANFLDVGGGASKDRVKAAFQVILKSEHVRGIFVNIFGGIMACDVVAQGIIEATKELGLKVPLVVRLEGTNAELGKKLLDESGLAIRGAISMSEGARMIVDLTRKGGPAEGSAEASK